jgi:hypothetical protein
LTIGQCDGGLSAEQIFAVISNAIFVNRVRIYAGSYAAQLTMYRVCSYMPIHYCQVLLLCSAVFKSISNCIVQRSVQALHTVFIIAGLLLLTALDTALLLWALLSTQPCTLRLAYAVLSVMHDCNSLLRLLLCTAGAVLPAAAAALQQATASAGLASAAGCCSRCGAWTTQSLGSLRCW